MKQVAFTGGEVSQQAALLLDFEQTEVPPVSQIHSHRPSSDLSDYSDNTDGSFRALGDKPAVITPAEEYEVFIQQLNDYTLYGKTLEQLESYSPIFADGKGIIAEWVVVSDDQ